MEVGLIRKVDIDSEMQQSYLDYAMSVIVARALPDARDGLKPVQRRVLFAMHDMGVRANTDFKKSARIVGEVLGKYHPHGDMAVYESMARLAQDFTMRAALVDGQGNFGSVDGDPPAAMRYTEARLTPFAMELLNQIDRDTVDFAPNFDGTLQEPLVLPAAAPNLLVNGVSGIAVGMATSIPPHNLGEVVDALVVLLREWERMDDIAVDDLMRHIKGPDFPTGGILMEQEDQNNLQSAYATGRGKVMVRGRVQAEDMGRGKSRLIITELPYQVNKAGLIERIAELVREGGLEGIADLRDESDRQGMRIVIELAKSAETEQVLLELYKRTPLQSTVSINMLALVEGEPRLLSLKQALRVYLDHRQVVVKRRSEHDLRKARQRQHILEGLRVALKHLDEIISLIRSAPDADAARERLMKRYALSEAQAQAILDLQLRRLASLERKKIEEEYKTVSALIKELEGLLKSPKRIRQVVEEELLAVKLTFNDRRRTQIVSLRNGTTARELLTTKDLTPAREVWVGVMEDGTVGRTGGDELSRVSGRSAPRKVVRVNTHHTLYLVAEDGRAAAVAVDSLPEVDKFTDGLPLHKVTPFEDDTVLAALFSTPPRSQLEGSGKFVLTFSRLGMVKKTALEELPGPSAQLLVLAKANPADSIGWAFISGGSDQFLMVTSHGMGIRFSESEVRPMGLVAAGVNGIKLGAADYVIGVERALAGQEVLVLASNAKAWRLPVEEFPLQGRYGQGVQVCRLERSVRLVGTLCGKRTQAGLAHFRQAAARSLRVDEVEATRRLRAGTPAFELKPADLLEEITPLADGLSYWSVSEKPAGKRGQTGARKASSAADESAKTKPKPRSRPAKLPEDPAGTLKSSPKAAAGPRKPRGTEKSNAETAPEALKKPVRTKAKPTSPPAEPQPEPKNRRGRPAKTNAQPPARKPRNVSKNKVDDTEP